MNSLDTNILIYAINPTCSEHLKAKAIYEELLDNPSSWILSDQVIFEFYRALRNSKVVTNPLNHKNALEQIIFLREESGALCCSYEISLWPDLIKHQKKYESNSVQIFDSILATTLLNNGVKNFYTRNTKDFKKFEFANLINPID